MLPVCSEPLSGLSRCSENPQETSESSDNDGMKASLSCGLGWAPPPPPPGSLSPLLEKESLVSFGRQVSSFPRYSPRLRYSSFFPKQKFTAPDWISRLPSPRRGVEIKIEWQIEIELKLLCSLPPEHMSANYLHVKGIFDLWGSPGAWREGPWKIGVAGFTPSSFYLAIGETHTIR